MENFNNSYSEFILHIKKIVTDITFFNKILNETENEKIIRVKNFNDSLNTTTLFNHFLKKKIKLFSHKEQDTLKVSESFFGSELSLKKIFNNQDDIVKNLFWEDLKKILLYYNEYLFSTDNTNLNIKNKIEKLNNHNHVQNHKENLNKILNTQNLNETTNSMINDIFGNFEKSFNGENKNPFANIMEISKTITDKYKDNIEKGDINLDEILSSMTKLPGMENMGGVVNMLTKQISDSNPEDKEKIIIDENFSTALVTNENNVNEDDNGLNVGSLLKTMNSFTNNGNSAENPMNNMMNVFNKLGQSNTGDSTENPMNNLMNVFNKLGQSNDSSDINNIVENELGIDMTKFNEQMSKLLDKND